jgi:hypothetical protein
MMAGGARGLSKTDIVPQVNNAQLIGSELMRVYSSYSRKDSYLDWLVPRS